MPRNEVSREPVAVAVLRAAGRWHGMAWLVLAAACLTPAQAQTDGPEGGGVSGDLTETAFWEDVPMVLSVSRLPQRLDDTPGAVTVIDREMIRMSGARDVVDLLRLVPGFRVTNSFESNAPLAGYHWIAVEDYVNRMLVLIDGRSVYSPYFMGSVGTGLQGVALEDIERIEVLRGTGSAAYGARAMLGTINIVTRDTGDTLGAYAHAAAGEDGVRDGMVRVGGGNELLRYRLSLDQRFDDGLTGAGGSDRVRRMNFRTDLQPTTEDRLELRAGQTIVRAGVGYADHAQNQLRVRGIDVAHVQVDWRRNLGVDDDILLQLSRTQEQVEDAFDVVIDPAILMATLGYLPSTNRVEASIGGQATSDNLLLQHTARRGQDVRLVWGGEGRRERVRSRALFDTEEALRTDFVRAFGNLEWRLVPDLLLNLGALYERSTIAESELMPRAMLNWKVAPAQTLRLGASRGWRPPSLFERHSNMRYYLDGTLVEAYYVSRGELRPETVLAREVGYLVSDPSSGASFDLRAFREDIHNLIGNSSYAFPGLPLSTDGTVDYFVNKADFQIQGVESQLKFRPWKDGFLNFSHSLVTSTQQVSSTLPPPVLRSMALMISQRLRSGASVSLQYYRADPYYFVGRTALTPPQHRTDLRLAWPLTLSQASGELSLVVQNLEAAYPDYVPETTLSRRAFVMLRLEQ